MISDPDRRGGQVFGLDLATALAARGRRVRTVALAYGKHARPLPVEVLGDRWWCPATLRRLRRAMREADVVVAHGSTTLPACALAGVGVATPFVYRNIGDPLYWANSALRRARVRLFLSRASAVAALWPGSASALRRRLGVRDDKLRVIPNGVPAARCPVAGSREQQDARRLFGLPAAAPVVAYVGALAEEKDVPAAIRAVAMLEDCHLLVVGDGPERQDLAGLAQTLAPRRVHFAGATERPAEALAAADAVVLPSRSEGMPAVLIEAGLSARPAVATDVGGVDEIVVPGRTGALVPPGNVPALATALRTVLADAAALGAAARGHCLDRFELEVVADAWDALLRDISRGEA